MFGGESGDHAARAPDRPAPRKHRGWRKFGLFLIILAVAVGVGRAFLPWAVRNYVNRTIDRSPLYTGNIGKVQIHLWRGAYSIQDVRLSKTTGDVPVPFFAAKRVDFAIQWNALLHHRVVGRLLMEQPELNFVDAPSEGEVQTGAGGPWLQMIRDLFPFKINSAIIHDGSIHFRAYQTPKPLDVYVSHFEASIDNLSNIRRETDPLVTKVQATGMVMDQAKLEYKMTLDPFSYRPTFHLAIRLLGLDVTTINDLALTYGKFDFKRGWLDLVLETDAKEGQLTGYVKPLFRNLRVFNLTRDLKEDNLLQFFWQALVGFTASILKNQSRDQFGTLIPFTGDASGATTKDIFATIGNILRNAFVRAYLPRLENGQEAPGGLEFQAPDFTDAISTADNSP
jgi:uncharacterized protein DUF748